MNNGRASSRGGVEDPLTPQPGPSHPPASRHKALPSSKRKAQDEEGNHAGNFKRIKVRDLFVSTLYYYELTTRQSSQLTGPANRSKTSSFIIPIVSFSDL